MQTVAQALLVLHLTGSGTALGLTTAIRFAPMLILAPWGGLIADRLDKRSVLYVTQALSGLLALAFGVLIGTHLIQLWMIYVLAAPSGSSTSSTTPPGRPSSPNWCPRTCSATR